MPSQTDSGLISRDDQQHVIALIDATIARVRNLDRDPRPGGYQRLYLLRARIQSLATADESRGAA